MVRPPDVTATDEAALRAFTKNADWAIDHRNLLDPFVGRFVAVLDEKIAAVADDYRTLRRSFGDRQDVYIRFVQPRGRRRVLVVGNAVASV